MPRSLRVNTFLAWLTLCVIWGSTWFFIKVGLQDLPPMAFASARFILALLILGGVAYVKVPRRPTRPERALILKTGILQFTFNYGLVFWGERFISSGLTALLQSTIPLFGFLIAHRVLHTERLTTKRLAGLLIGLVGVAIIFSHQLSLGNSDAVLGSCAYS